MVKAVESIDADIRILLSKVAGAFDAPHLADAADTVHASEGDRVGPRACSPPRSQYA
jgi:hypothetical protein